MYANKKQQQFIDRVTEAENDTTYRTISPGLCSDCPDCQSSFGYDDERAFDNDIASGAVCDEGGFSYQDCDCCGSSLGGDRYAAHGHVTMKDGAVVLCHFDICEDCLQYLANGTLPE